MKIFVLVKMCENSLPENETKMFRVLNISSLIFITVLIVIYFLKMTFCWLIILTYAIKTQGKEFHNCSLSFSTTNELNILIRHLEIIHLNTFINSAIQLENYQAYINYKLYICIHFLYLCSFLCVQEQRLFYVQIFSTAKIKIWKTKVLMQILNHKFQ